MSLAGLHRSIGAAGGPALQAVALADRAEHALDHGRGATNDDGFGIGWYGDCHPFRRGRWLWMHNGAIAGFHSMKRELALAVDPSLYADIEGTTDSEMFFYLALTFGLERDPVAAVARAVGLIERAGREHGERFPMQMTVATTDGTA